MVVVRTASGVPAPAPHELRRERLLEVLHRHSTWPLLLLVAPAGFGKSTLAAAYARESGGVVAWLTLHAGDRDSRFFFGRVRDALQAAFGGPDLFTELDRGLREGAEGIGLARLLLTDLAHAPAGFILVLDDYHAVQDTEEVQEAINVLVRGLPEMGQIVITAREAPPVPATQLLVSDRIFVLGAEDLRFSPEESAALRRALGWDATEDDPAEGWVAGILLGGAPHQLGVAGGTLLGSYVEREVLARLSPTERRWLETLAAVESITPAGASRLARAGPWTARLATLAQRCPFLVVGQDGSYRLHALVRETLLNRLRRAPPAQARRVWMTARALAEEADDVAGVVRASQELGQSDDAVALVRRAVDEAMQVGRWAAALASLDLLPEAVRRARPDLSLVEAHALVQSGRPEPAREAAEAALHHASRSGDVAIQVGAVVELANIARYMGDLAAAEDWLAAADQLLLHAGLPPRRRRLLEGRALGVRGVCQAVRGQMPEARESLEAAERLLAPEGTTRELGVVLYNLGILCFRAGDYAEAQRALANAARRWRVIRDRTFLASTQVVLGCLQLGLGSLEAAGATLTWALEAARLAGAVRIEAHVLASLGAWHRANGRLDEAAVSLDDSLRLAEELAEEEPTVEALRLRAEVAIVQADLRLARELLARAQVEGQRLESSYQLAGVERALGRLHLAEGSGHHALAYLESARQRGAPATGPDEQMVTLYWLGTAYLVVGRVREAEETLGQAVALAEEIDGFAVLAGPAAEDPRLLRHGLQLGERVVALSTIERLAATRQPWTGVRQSAPLEVIAQHDLPRVDVRLFGMFVLHRNGELLDSGARGVGRAHELFALLVLHPDGLPGREIAALLWPDMAPERAQHNLQMTTYVLRRLLGSKPAARHTHGRYQLSPHLVTWADVRVFDELLARARVAADEEACRLLEEAVELYRGPLLDGAGWDWAAPFRETYHRRYVAGLLRLAELLASQDRAASDALAERLLALEPESEAAYERLLANAQARGDMHAARRIARRYQCAMERLGLRPNPRLLQAAP